MSAEISRFRGLRERAAGVSDGRNYPDFDILIGGDSIWIETEMARATRQ